MYDDDGESYDYEKGSFFMERSLFPKGKDGNGRKYLMQKRESLITLKGDLEVYDRIVVLRDLQSQDRCSLDL